MKEIATDDYRITGRESLNALLMEKGERHGRFILDIGNMDDMKAKKFENDLNKFYASCGCATGQYFLITALIADAAYLFITGQPLNNGNVIIRGFIMVLIAAVLGKFIGKLMDGYQFKKTIKNLSQELA